MEKPLTAKCKKYLMKGVKCPVCRLWTEDYQAHRHMLEEHANEYRRMLQQAKTISPLNVLI